MIIDIKSWRLTYLYVLVHSFHAYSL